jgi:hypothetical protein
MVARDAGSLIKGRSIRDSIVFASRFLFRRMRRPVDAQMPEVVETDGDAAAALIEGLVQIQAQACDSGAFQRIGGAG